MRDSYMKDILINLNTSLLEKYPTDYTYQHGNGKSVLDYILHSKTGIASDVKIMTDNHLNTSPHAPVTAYVPHIQRLMINNKKEPVKRNSVNWEKLDKQKYQELLKNRLDPLVATDM